MQLPEARFVPCLRSGPIWLPPELAKGGVSGACANQAYSCPICLLPVGDHLWSWFQAAETTNQAAVPTEAEAAQTLIGPMGSKQSAR